MNSFYRETLEILIDDTKTFFTGVIGTLVVMFALYFVIVTVSKQVYADFVDIQEIQNSNVITIESI